MNWRVLCSVLLGLAALALLWRFVDLERDPPPVSASIGEWGDPGIYLYNARSHSLFGEWRAEEGPGLYVKPGYVFLAALWFYIFGFGCQQAVLLSTLAGFVVIFATALCAECVAAQSDPGLPKYWAGCAAITSLLLSYVVFAFQRIPKGDMESVAVCALTGAAFSRVGRCWPENDTRPIYRFSLLAGFGMGLAPFVKLYSGLFSGACLFAWCASYFLLDLRWRQIWRRATPFLILGLLLSTLVWLGWVVWLVHLNRGNQLLRTLLYLRTWFSGLPSGQAESAWGGALSPGRFLQTNLFYRQPVETVLATLAVCRCALEKRWNWPLLLAFTWLMVGVAVMSVMVITPLRYRILFIPPSVVLAVSLWTELATGKMGALKKGRTVLASVASGGIISYIAVYSLSIRLPGFRALSDSAPFWLAVFSLTPIIGVLLWLALERLSGQLIAFALAAAVMLVALPQWWIGERATSHDLRNAAYQVANEHPTAVLGGEWAGQLGLWIKLNTYLEWTPAARGRVTLIASGVPELAMVPLKWHEIERFQLRRIRYTIVVAEVRR